MVFRAAREARKREHERAGATAMQAVFRGYCGRKVARVLQEERLRLQRLFACMEWQVR